MKKLLTYLVVIVLTAVISSGITIVYLNNSDNEPVNQREKMINMMNNIYQELELEDSQIDEFNRITGVFHSKGKVLGDSLKSINRTYYSEFTQDTINSNRLDSISDNYGKMQVKIKQHISWYYKEVESMLSEKQLLKLKGIYVNALKQTESSK